MLVQREVVSCSSLDQTVAVFVWLPETYAPVLLRERANRLSKATGKVYRSEFEREKALQIGPLFKQALLRPWLLLFREPIVLLLSLYLAISECRVALRVCLILKLTILSVYGTLYMLFAGRSTAETIMERHN
jgi:hypothetical protein